MRPLLRPPFWLSLIAYVAVSVGIAGYIDRFTAAGISGTPRDMGISTAACLPFLVLEFGATIGGSALLVTNRFRAIGYGLLAGVPIALVGILVYIDHWGG